MTQLESFAEKMDCNILGKLPKPIKSRRVQLPLIDISLRDRNGKDVYIGDYVYLQNNINRLFRIEGILQSANCYLLWNGTRYYPQEVTKVTVKF
jgi:hypothetical protein